MIKKVLYKIFGTRNERLLKNYNKMVAKINYLESSVSVLSDIELREKTAEFKNRFQGGETLEQILPEAFAVCREASYRVFNMRHFDVQLIGGMVLNDGKIAEMKTGEGKTLVGTLAAYLNAIAGFGVHVVTVNDYLAQRDATEMSKLYNFLGLTVGINLSNIAPEAKRDAYLADITYGTNNEFGFDYLRDNMVFDTKEKVQRELSFAIVDEVDSILIDEARTPLIISGPAEGSSEFYVKLNQVPPLLVPQAEEKSEIGDFWVDEKNNNVILSEAGHIRVEQILSEMGLLEEGDSLYNVNNISLMHHLLASLKAHYVYHKDQHYVIQNGEVIIVDEFTGRLMSGRRWSDGLHQAVEAKEGVEIQRENQTLATITLQNYFRIYKKLAGMTGTADTEAFEFQQIYRLETVVIPTNKHMVRNDYNDKIYMNINDKYAAIIEDIRDCSKRNQPVLVGTTSVENSEVLSKLLNAAKLKHEVLNAKQHAREAEIIVQAGYPGAITVATNMAGRGTDIILGGNPKPAVNQIKDDDALSEEQKMLKINQLTKEWQERNKQVLDAGGLYIIGTERHESRRIDNQLRGRAGRQGDNGASRFYLSLDDPLLRIFGGERMRSMMQKLGMKPGESIEHKWLSRSIESAQRKVEAHNFDIRKQLLDYDDVSNEQRKVIYQQRDEILQGTNLSEITNNIIAAVIDGLVDEYIPYKSMPEEWDIEGLEIILKNEYLLDYSISDELQKNNKITEEMIKEELVKLAQAKYREKIINFVTKVQQEIKSYVEGFITEDKTKWNVGLLDDFCKQNSISAEVNFVEYVANHPDLTAKELIDYFSSQVIVKAGGVQTLRFERGVLLQHIDYYWREHLTQLEQLRQGIHLRGYAQKDPKQEYKQEAFSLFSSMLDGVKRDAARMLLASNLQGSKDLPEENTSLNDSQMIHHDAATILQAQVLVNNDSNGSPSRNSSCPCGSGKKYKHCHGKLA